MSHDALDAAHDVLALDGVTVRIDGRAILDAVDLRFARGTLTALVGPNGAGKSTLLRGILGRQSPDEGSASLGSSVAIGEIDQARSLLVGERPLAETFEGFVPEMNAGEVRTLLAKFGLKADHVTRPVDELSPGERTRAGLALLQARGVNVLVLDEPTNHLDLPAIEQLEQALESYTGTLLLVTHDRRMLDAVRVERRWHVEHGAVTGVVVQGDYAVVGDYKGYLHWLRLDNGELAARERAGGDAIKATPVVADGILLVQNVDGKLTAFRLAN